MSGAVNPAEPADDEDVFRWRASGGGGSMPAMSSGSASAPPRAVFLSYAREDAAAAPRIAEALRGAGAEGWFNQDKGCGSMPSYFTFGLTKC